MAKAKPRAIRFEPRWCAVDASLKAAIGKLVTLLEEHEHISAPRRRHRRAHDAANFHRLIEAVACNLLAVSMAAPDRPLAVPTANVASRFSPILGKPARKLIDLMVELGLVAKTRGYPLRGPSTIRPTRELARHLPLGKLDWNALHLSDDPQLIMLKPVHDDDEEEDAKPIRSRRDTPKTRQWLRDVTTEMQAINAAIKSAPIECDARAAVHNAEQPGKLTVSLVTLHHQSLRRIFNGTWDQGGRLFGGWWQTMKREDRFRHIKIGGEPIALVDFGQLFLRLAFAEAGIKPPPDDLYDVTGNEHRRPDWKRLRSTRKKLVNALFFRTSPLKQWPGATFEERAEMRDAFPPGTKPLDAIRAITDHHRAVADWFAHGHGLRFMRKESDLIAFVSIALLKQRIVALPIHDAVLVAERHAPAAKTVMEKAAKKLTGANIPADIETATDYEVFD